LIDEVLTTKTVFAAGTMTEESVSVMGGEAFVEEMEREVGVGFSEGFGEGDSFDGLRAIGAVGVEGVADYDDFDAVLTDKSGDGFKVGALVGAVQGEERLRGEAEGIGDCETDALVTYVERECARVGHES
jgi:hypothetical protein